jgi:hypothetical protein
MGNPGGHLRTLRHHAPENTAAVRHGVYAVGDRVLAPRAQEFADALMAAPHTVVLSGRTKMAEDVLSWVEVAHLPPGFRPQATQALGLESEGGLGRGLGRAGWFCAGGLTASRMDRLRPSTVSQLVTLGCASVPE